jgi:hypothetical protein
MAASDRLSAQAASGSVAAVGAGSENRMPVIFERGGASILATAGLEFP